MHGYGHMSVASMQTVSFLHDLLTPNVAGDDDDECSHVEARAHAVRELKPPPHSPQREGLIYIVFKNFKFLMLKIPIIYELIVIDNEIIIEYYIDIFMCLWIIIKNLNVH